MTTKDAKKLIKALEYLEKAEQLLNEVSQSDKQFRYSANSNFRNNRIYSAIEIVKLEVNEFTKTLKF